MKLMQLSRLLQLASPALPVGAYTYSQGLEWAVESGVIRDEASALQWIADLLEWNLGRFEAPLLARLLAAARAAEDLAPLNETFLASRETSELRAETVQMGYSMTRLLGELEDFPRSALDALRSLDQPSFPAAWACAAVAWEIDDESALTAYLWSWAENQVMAALKAGPLGQAAGQRVLLALGERIPPVVEHALALDATEFSNFAPGFAIACSRHETQYSRLFRS
ncbi:MAG: urease accessory protein UreF [Proteobacteria bacterium]|nr:urease accessory protein UreF [Pseudomonadota bacterium]